LHEQKAFADKYVSVEKYDNTQYLKDRALSLPIHPYLRKEQVKQVVELIQETI
jgi:Predicted pyridoxal phosphate-dependent enzyme apparently involved in regulation of cell wall biogenesis